MLYFQVTNIFSTQLQMHSIIAILEFDISNENEWICMNSFNPQGSGDFTGITYDSAEKTIWVLHNQQRTIQSYTVNSNGDFEKGDDYFTFQDFIILNMAMWHNEPTSPWFGNESNSFLYAMSRMVLRRIITTKEIKLNLGDVQAMQRR